MKLEYSARGVVDTTGLVTALQLPFTEQQDVVEFRELLFGLLINSMPSIQVVNSSNFGRYLFLLLPYYVANIST